MSRNKKRSFHEEVKKHKVFVIYHDKTKRFYVHFTTASSLETVFSSHYSLKNYRTKKLFSEYRETIDCPQIYQIEELDVTPVEAYSRVVVWLRYFLSQGFVSMNDSGHIENALDLTDANLEEYLKIKDIPLDDVLSKANHKCLNYGRQRSESTDEKPGKKQVKFFCEHEEYKIIQAQARRNNKTVSAYLREVALQGKVLDINYQAILDHTKEVNQLRNTINAMVEMFVRTRQIFPVDVEVIVETMKSIEQSEKKLLNGFLRHNAKVRSRIKKVLLENLSEED